MVRVLVVEDDARLARMLARGLGDEGFGVDLVGDGVAAEERLVAGGHDACVLDLLLPGQDGFAVLGRVRGAGVRTPILVLTARDAVQDRVRGLNLGADDYLVKPFAFAELVARLGALLRRGVASGARLRAGDLEIDAAGHRVLRAGENIELSVRQFALLDLLLRHRGQVITRAMILKRVCGYDFNTGTNIVDVHVAHLRQKIDRPGRPSLIQTVRGVGYRFAGEDRVRGAQVNRPRTLRGRVALFCGALLSLILILYTGAVFAIVRESEDETGHESEAEEAETLARRLLVAIGLALPVAVTAAVAGTLWIVRRGLAPIDGVVRSAGTFGAEQPGRRIPLTPGATEEVERLVVALNGMLARIDLSVGGLRRFTADTSHELRTPLAVLMGEIEVALRRPGETADLRGTLEGSLEQMQDLARLLEVLLTLARADAGELPLRIMRLDAAELVFRSIEPYAVVASARGLDLKVHRDGGCAVDADPLWLGRAIANLIDNACKFTPAGGEIEVRVGASAGRVVIAVRDSGPGMDVEEQGRVFERFYRGAAARGSAEGFGLGLPLAHDIVRSLGGALLLDSAPGGGTCFRIDLPEARERPPSGSVPPLC